MDEKEENRKLRENEKFVKEFLGNSKIKRKIMKTVFHTAFNFYLFSNPANWNLLRDRDFRELALSKKYRVGLFEGAILSNSLYVPNDQSNNFRYEDSNAGEFVSFDPLRKEILPESNILRKGIIYSFHLDEISENNPEKRTPYGLLEIFDLEHMKTLHVGGLTELCEKGFLRETNYEDAYSRVGLNRRYMQNLSILGLDEKPVYQVTPKGNTLLFIDKREGNKKEEKRQESLKPEFAH